MFDNALPWAIDSVCLAGPRQPMHDIQKEET